MRSLLLTSGLLLVACGDNGGGPDGSMIDSRVPDAHQYRLDRGKVTPADLGLPDDLPLPDQGAPKDTAVPDQGGGPIKTHQAPMTVTFDSANGGFVGTKDWEWKLGISFNKSDPNCSSTPAPPTAAYSGSGMWGTRINGCYSPLNNNATSSSGSCKNDNPKDDSILSFRVNIPSAWKYVDLIFYEWNDINYYFDWNEVRVDDGSGSKSVLTYCASTHTPPTGWKKKTVILDDYAGKTVTVSFHFMASSSVNLAGWYIDNVTVQEFK